MLKWWIILIFPRWNIWTYARPATSTLQTLCTPRDELSGSFKVNLPAPLVSFINTHVSRDINLNQWNSLILMDRWPFFHMWEMDCAAEDSRLRTESTPCPFDSFIHTRCALPRELSIRSAPIPKAELVNCFPLSFSRWGSRLRGRARAKVARTLSPGRALVLHSTTHAVCTHRSWEVAHWSVPSGYRQDFFSLNGK